MPGWGSDSHHHNQALPFTNSSLPHTLSDIHRTRLLGGYHTSRTASVGIGQSEASATCTARLMSGAMFFGWVLNTLEWSDVETSELWSITVFGRWQATGLPPVMLQGFIDRLGLGGDQQLCKFGRRVTEYQGDGYWAMLKVSCIPFWPCLFRSFFAS